MDDVPILETGRFSLGIPDVCAVNENVYEFPDVVLIIKYSVFYSRKHSIQLFDER